MTTDLGRQAVADYLDRLEAAARADLPDDIDVARDGDTVVLTGPGLALRRVTDVRLRGLAAGAVRR